MGAVSLFCRHLSVDNLMLVFRCVGCLLVGLSAHSLCGVGVYSALLCEQRVVFSHSSIATISGPLVSPARPRSCPMS